MRITFIKITALLNGQVFDFHQEQADRMGLGKILFLDAFPVYGQITMVRQFGDRVEILFEFQLLLDVTAFQRIGSETGDQSQSGKVG